MRLLTRFFSVFLLCSPLLFAQTFTQQIGQTFTGGFDSEIWSSVGKCSGVTTVTVNYSGGGTMYASAFAVSGISSSTAYTTNTSSGASSGTTPTGPSITTTQTGDFVLEGYDPAHAVASVSAGWQCAASGGSPACSTTTAEAYLSSNTATAGSYAPTWTLNSGGGWAATGAAFHASSWNVTASTRVGAGTPSGFTINLSTTGIQTIFVVTNAGTSPGTISSLTVNGTCGLSGSTGYPMVIKYGGPRVRKIPWDRPRRQILLEKI